MDNTSTPSVRLDATKTALVITDLTVTSPAVTTEALRWAEGRRGLAQPADLVEQADLTAYANQALVVGAQAIAAAGGTQDVYNLEQLVQDVGSRTSDAAARAATSTNQAVSDATEAVRVASTEATKALTVAADAARQSFGRSVSDAKSQLHEQVLLLFGGDDPQLVARLDGLLTRFEAGLVQRTDTQTASLFDAAAKALNPDDPTSPLAKHQAQIQRQHADLARQLGQQNTEIVTGLRDLRTTIAVQLAAAEAKASLASVTPLKGGTYEDKVNELLEHIAAGLGDKYTVSRNRVGVIAHCKKGDGVLTVMGGPSRVVFEMSNSGAREWGPYLDEAERNRQSGASLGLVPTVGQNGNESIRVLGPRRLVMAFDPEADDPAMLRTVIQLLRVSALAAAARHDDSSAGVAAERIAQALDELPRLERIRKTASSIRKGAEQIDGDANRVAKQLGRLLSQAQQALEALATPALTSNSEAGAA